ncbi:MAG: amidohydrolase family protein [Streptosporangiales bacterium]|nr:amidohydrolase family protein [Streptosporangiales bacterium]
MKAGRFVIDTHVHAQRFAAGGAVREALSKAATGGERWETLSHVMGGLTPYDNSARLIYDMECYGVDMGVLLPAFGMTNELNLQLVEKYPDRFVAVCSVDEYAKRVAAGEEEWSIEGVCQELDRLLGTGKFVGIGEVAPYMPMPSSRKKPIGRVEAIDNLLAICEVADKYDVTLGFHTGCPMGYDAAYSTGGLGPMTYNPLWAQDLASAFPNLKIILVHGGIQAWWSEKIYEDCLLVAGSRDNVYLETGLWWRELYAKAVQDPNIGPEKLIWGTDWGASMQFHTQLDSYPPSYAVQLRKQGPPSYQIDYWGWSLREITGVRMAQDDLNLILGGNACRIFRIEPPHNRLFREPTPR